MTSWLNKQKKQTILDLSNEAGFPQEDDLRKDELIEKLDVHLQANSTRLARNPSFQPYFDTRRTPFKPRPSSASGAGVTTDDGEVKSVVKARGRRTTKVKQETEDEDPANLSPSQAVVPASSAVTKTPGRPRRRSELLPPSPADVADDVEYAATRIYTGLDNIITNSGIQEGVENLRELCSSVIGVQMTVLILELWGLQRAILPRAPAFTIPAVHLGAVSTPRVPVWLPDFFRLVTPDFWSTGLLWATTSVFIPLLFAYFYNLSSRNVKRHGTSVTVSRYIADPLTFNIVKALVTWIVYSQGYTFGLIDERVVLHVENAMFGGSNGIMIGSFIGMLVSLYEAAQRK